MTAGRFMAEDGFVETRFTPIVDVRPLDELSFRYVHYPPLAEIINGAVQKVTGSDSLMMFRLIFIGFSALSVWFFFSWVRRIWNERVAWVATALFATNSLWLKYADCIHSHPLHLMTGFGALWWLTKWIDHRRRRDLAIFLGWCAAAFMSSYDYYFFLPIMIIATPWLLGHRFRSRLTLQVTALGALGCGAGLAMKFGLAIWALGWDGFIGDLHFQLLERATDKLSYKITREFYKILFFRHYRFMSPVFYVVLGVWVAALFIPRVRRFVGKPAPWVLIFAGLAFIFGMKQLFCEQYHVSLSLLPFFAVAGAILFVRAAEHRIGLALAVTCALVTYGWHVKEVVTFEHAFLELEQLEPVRAELDRNDRHNGFIYSTLGFTPPFRYVLDKHMVSIAWIRPEDLASFFEQRTRALGGLAPYLVHYEPLVTAAEDTKILSTYAGSMRQIWWLREPWWSKRNRQEQIGARVRKQLAVIETVTDKILVSGDLTLYRLSPEKLRDVLYPPPSNVPTTMTATSKEMARAASPQASISKPEKLGTRSVRYSLHHRPARLVLTVRGEIAAPPATPARDFTLRIPQDVSTEERVTMTVIPMLPDTTLQLLGERPQTFVLGPPGEPREISFVLPAREAAARIDEIEVRFEVDRVDDKGRGVAIVGLELSRAI